MQRISGSPFIDGEPSTNTKGTTVSAAWLNAVQEEIAGTIEGLGGVLNPANNGQLLAQLLAKFAPLISPVFTGSPAQGPTPNQFDNSLKLANTAFLKTMGEAFGGIKSVSGAGPLNATYAGQLTIFSGTTYANTLPSASAFPSGSTLTFQSAASGVVTLNRAGTDVISFNNATQAATSVTLGSGDTLALVSNGVGIWEAIAGSAQLQYAAIMKSATLLANSGYRVFPAYPGDPSPMIFQWGDVPSATTSGQAITLPITFPNSVHAHGAFLNGAVAPSQYLSTGCTTTTITVYANTGTAGGRFIAIGK